MARRLLLTASTIAIAIAVNDQRALAGGGPMGGQVVAGQASITSPNANSTLITQSTQKAVINWQSFSIAQGSSVQFAQPNASAIALNRVVGSTPSNINGSLFANGQVWLINGNGIIFGKGSQINVGSLIATTADMRDSDFMSGNYSFGMASANPNAGVQNSGTITVAKGGAAILAGATVSNDGLIRANMGQVALASGSTFTVDFAGDNLLRFAVASPVTQTPKDANGNPKSALVSNSGTISAPGGQVTMTARAANDVVDNVINNTGMVEATSVSEKNGEIILDAGSGTAQAGGTLDASGTKSGETGGTVQILGNNVQVADGATINVSGHSGGGSVLIGGDLHGAGSLPHAQTTAVGKAVITADATGSGNGGTVVAWSDGQTSFAASVSAKGGAEGGNGGQVETSGVHLRVDAAASVDTTAPKGATGDWLLDPTYLVIESNVDADYTDVPQNGTIDVNSGGTVDFVDPSSITHALQSTDVTLEASQEIDVLSPIDYSSSHALSLLSEHDIYVSAEIQNAGSGAVSLVAGWDGSTTDPTQFTKSGVFGAHNGLVYIGTPGDTDDDADDSEEASEGEIGNVAVGSASGVTTVAGGTVMVEGHGGYAQIGYHGTGGGDINVFTTGDLTVSNGQGEGYYAQIGNGSLNSDVGGAVTGDISINVAGTTNITDNTDGEGAPAWIGNATSNDFVASGNVTIVTGSVDNSDNAGSDTLGAMLLADLGTTDVAGSGGDVSLQLTSDGTLDSGHVIGTMNYSSPHAFTFASAGGLNLTNSIQNSGTGAIDVSTAGTLTVGSEDASGNVAVGSKGGTTTVSGSDVNVDAEWGYAQIGYAGGGGSGNITVNATGDVTLTASSDSECTGCYAQIGHGGVFADGGDNSGNIAVTAGGDVSLTGGTDEHSYAQIGNGGDTTSGDDSGDIGVTAGGSVLLTGENDYAQIGNGGWGLEGNSGGNVTVAATGDVILTGGAGDGDFFGYAQIGNGGQLAGGTISGDIAVTSGGDTTLTSGTLPNGNSNYVQIGNGAADGSVSGDVSGDVSVIAAGTLTLDPTAGAQVWIGNLTGEGNETGNLTMIAGSESDFGSDDIGQIVQASLGTSDSTGGNVTVGITGAGGLQIDHGFTYASPHTLNLLSTHDIVISGTMQNSSTGAINAVAGWNGTTFNPAHFTDAGVFGNNGGSVFIGGPDAEGNSVLGSAGGTLTVAAANVTIEGDHGYAQLGYHGTGSGAIVVDALHAIALNGGTGSDFAGIGNSGSPVSNSGRGDVTVSANTITGQNQSGIVADALTMSVSGPNSAIGAAGAPINLWVNSLAATANGANAYFRSRQGLSIGVGSDGIALDGGDLVLDVTGDLAQTQTISANTVTVTSSGAIVLNNAGNGVTGTLSLTGANDVSFANSVATTLGATSGNHVTVTTSGGGINLTGVVNGTTNVSLSSPGDITEAGGGSIAGGGLVATSSGGGIALGNAANAVTGTIKLSAHDDATFENASAISLDTSTAHNLTLTALSGGITLTGATTATGNATFNAVSDVSEAANGSLSAQGLTATSSGGAITMTAPNNAVTGTVGLSAANDVAFANTVATTLGATSGNHVTVSTTSGGIAVNGTVHGAANLNLNAPGDITEGGSGAITGGGLNAVSSSGGIALGNAANNVTGTVKLSAHNDAAFTNASAIALDISNANNLTLTALSGGIALNGAVTATGTAGLTAASDITEGANGTLAAATLHATSTGGAVALTGNGNAIGTLLLSAHNDGTLYDNSSVTLSSFSVGGNATVLSKGSITAPSSIQTPGNVTLVAGWDGTTTAPASLANAGVYGNNSGNVTIGGAGASGNVAVGSTAGTTTVEGAGVQLAAVNGYAMIGGHGPATGSIVVNATGNVSLSGGAGTSDFAQIGNGGQGISGNDSGAITVTAGGDVILSGGAGSEAYSQIGQGGAETNAGSSGYTNDSTINVHATNATLNGGTGNGAYAQVGQGGFKAGENLAGGTATNSGNVSVIVTHAVALNGGGNDAYAQVGNGGDQSNMNAAASAHGLNTGDITVTAPNGPSGSVTMTAGNGTDAYAQIGNGGFGANEHTQAIPANFVNSGNVSVTDLTLQGGNGGANSFAQIGDGGPGSVGNVSGNIAIDANGGKVIIIAGTAPGSGSNIGNVTGEGTVTGSVTGFVSPTDAALNGTVNTSTNGTNTPKNLTNTNDVYIPPNSETSNDVVYSAAFLSTNDKGDNAIETLSGGDNEEETSSDTLTVTVANSLTKSKGSNSQTVIIGLLKQYTPLGSNTPHGVPPADQEYSSWGNEALWQ